MVNELPAEFKLTDWFELVTAVLIFELEFELITTGLEFTAEVLELLVKSMVMELVFVGAAQAVNKKIPDISRLNIKYFFSIFY